MKDILKEIGAERKRQILKEGWSSDHDDLHTTGQLALAAAGYVLSTISNTNNNGDFKNRIKTFISDTWPWHWSWYKPTNPERDLIKAAALIIAEIERIRRNK